MPASYSKCFGFVVDEFSQLYYKNFDLRARLFKILANRRSKIHRWSISKKKQTSLLFEILIFGHRHRAILFNDFSLKVVRRTHRHGFSKKKKLYTQQSEIISVFPPKCPFEPAENARSLCRNTNGFSNVTGIHHMTKVRYRWRAFKQYNSWANVEAIPQQIVYDSPFLGFNFFYGDYVDHNTSVALLISIAHKRSCIERLIVIFLLIPSFIIW